MDDVNVLVYVKGDQKYIFTYYQSDASVVLRQLGRFASNPDLDFTWYDAAVLSQRIRTQKEDEWSRP